MKAEEGKLKTHDADLMIQKILEFLKNIKEIFTREEEPKAEENKNEPEGMEDSGVLEPTDDIEESVVEEEEEEEQKVVLTPQEQAKLKKEEETKKK